MNTNLNNNQKFPERKTGNNSNSSRSLKREVTTVETLPPKIIPYPLRNASLVGSHVYSHSGEFTFRIIDFELPGRGFSLQFIRKYRSGLANVIGPVGRGWIFSYAKHIELVSNDIVYHDGLGQMYRFKRVGTKMFSSPDGLYAILISNNENFLLQHRHGNVFTFESPANGGRLLSMEDRNGNTLQFKYLKKVIHVTDSFNRQLVITYDENKVKQIQDSAGRVWSYRYDHNDCLVEVIQPATEDYPNGLSIKYVYDKTFRLISVTDPNGNTFLRNYYDQQDRVEKQEHGNGYFEFKYKQISIVGNVPVFRTDIRQKNGSHLSLTHNASGQVIERTLMVEASSLTKEDRSGSKSKYISLTTKSKFNQHGELIERIFPAGDITCWSFDDNHKDPRARGNLLQVIRKPNRNIQSDQKEIATLYTYEPKFQRRSSITNASGQTIRFRYDAHGNLIQKLYPPVTVQSIGLKTTDRKTKKKQLVENFEYNQSGQLIRTIDTRNAVNEYWYFAQNDPTGVKNRKGIHCDSNKKGGYLAKIIRDPLRKGRKQNGIAANLITELGYNSFGNVTTIWDSKGNPKKFIFNQHNRLVKTISSKPFQYEATFRYDRNMNPIEVKRSFDHNVLAPDGAVISQTSMIQQKYEYNALNNVVRITTLSDGQTILQSIERDASENIICKVQPMGNKTEYIFDARNQVVEKRFGVGSKEETSIQYTYTKNGRRSSKTNGTGKTISYQYDGFHRYLGYSNPGGTSRKQWYNEVNRITRIDVTGDPGFVTKEGKPIKSNSLQLLQSWFHYDELNRRVRTDRSWRDTRTGKSLGKSNWDRTNGIVSAIAEYDDNHRPSKIWYETGNIVTLQYDGANRVISSSDANGESISMRYDENGNVVRIERLGPEEHDNAERFQNIVALGYDELDRVVWRSVNGELPESYTYNALGLRTTHKKRAGVQTDFLHDGFGRFIGQTMMATIKNGGNTQRLTRHVNYNNNSLITARINAIGSRTDYQYDSLNRLSTIIYPNKQKKTFERDGNGKIARIVDPNGNIISHSFDNHSRLTERRVQSYSGEEHVERYHYDGLNRLVSATSNGVTILRQHDSLSRILLENQNGSILEYAYDAPGNRTKITYPSGEVVRKTYDIRGRITEVWDGQNKLISSYVYRSGRNLQKQVIADVMEVDYAYNPCKNSLRELIYRTKDGDILEGTRYRYTDACKPESEVQLYRGERYGECYYFDSADRLVKVKYDVEDVDDPASKFGREVEFDLNPSGLLKRIITRDGNGKILSSQGGVESDINNYLSLGDRKYEYDRNGNRIREDRESQDEFTEKKCTFNYSNRITNIELLDSEGHVIKTVEYKYDVFGRQIRLRITDDQGSNEFTRIWNGRQLIEERQNGKLVKSYLYGAHTDEPLVMRRYSSKGKDYYYAYNGRGYVTALLDDAGNVLERYRYEFSRQHSVSESNGKRVPTEVAQRKSSYANSIFIAGTISDDVTENLYGPNGSSFDRFSGKLDHLSDGSIGGHGNCTPNPFGDDFTMVDSRHDPGMRSDDNSWATPYYESGARSMENALKNNEEGNQPDGAWATAYGLVNYAVGGLIELGEKIGDAVGKAAVEPDTQSPEGAGYSEPPDAGTPSGGCCTDDTTLRNNNKTEVSEDEGEGNGGVGGYGGEDGGEGGNDGEQDGDDGCECESGYPDPDGGGEDPNNGQSIEDRAKGYSDCGPGLPGNMSGLLAHTVGGCNGEISGLGSIGRHQDDNPRSCGNGHSNSYLFGIGGMNPALILNNNRINTWDPSPDPEWGIMGPGAGGDFTDPSLGYTDPPPDGVISGGILGGAPDGGLTPPSTDNGDGSPLPEQSGGTCGSGIPSGTPNPDCSRY